MKQFCIFLLTSILTYCATAQEYSYENFNTSNSQLPSNTIFDVFVDDENVKWIGTENGLVKYINESWVVYNTQNSGLPHNLVRRIVKDTDGVFWLGTQGGLASFDGQNWQTYTKDNSSLPHNWVYGLKIDNSHRLWIATYSGLAVKNGDSWTVYKENNSALPSDLCHKIDVDSQNRVWVSNYGGGLVSINNGDFNAFNTENSQMVSNLGSSVAVDANDNVWVGTFSNYGLAKFDGDNWTIFNNSNSPISLNSILEIKLDPWRNIWVCQEYGGGVHRINPSSNDWMSLSNIPHSPTGIAFEQNGTVWISTTSSLVKASPVAVAPQGIGSQSEPYQIASWQNLYWLSQNPNYWFDENNYNPYYFEQTADIDLAEASPAIETWAMGKGWLPIGKEKEFDLDHDSKAFKSVYDGKGFSIKNLYINRPTKDNIGLFGYTEYAIIKNIKLENTNIVGNNNVGAVVGKQTGFVEYPSIMGLYSCSVSGTVTGNENVGGLVGANEDGYIEKSHSSVTVNGEWKVGGLVGLHAKKAGSTSTKSHIVDCYSTGSVIATGNYQIGGLVGYNSLSEIKNSYSVGSITAPQQQDGYAYSVGGLVGNDYEGTITNSYWDTETSGLETSEGGEGKTTAEMKLQSTYTDWDFEMVWQICESVNSGYPSYVNFEPQGQGTEENPYLIATWHNLKWISENAEEWDKHYLQTANIEFPEAIKDWDNGKGWSPIGNSTYNFFTGVYNGQNFTISNLYINRDVDYIGLFGNVEANEGKLNNIKIFDAEITGNTYVGALAGKIYWTSVNNCHSSGKVTGFSHVGGLVGSFIWTEKMIGCTSSAEVKGLTRIGGLIGHLGGNADTGGVENCSSTGNVSGEEFVGGFAGEGSGARILASHSTGSVSGKDGVGGFIGTAEGGSIRKCYSTGLVTGSPDANSNESYNIGGFIGTANNSATIENTYTTGNVSGCNNVGGFVGYNYESQIKYSYCIGSVTANVSNAGGFAAVLDGGTVSASFWNTETSGLTESDGGEGITTVQMKEKGTFTEAGWDFENIWGISAAENNGYPTFSVKHTLTVSIVGNGIVKVNDEEYTDEISVEPGTTLTLDAIASNGWQFEGWSGDLSSTNTLASITMDGNKSVTATFAEVSATQYSLTISISGSGTVKVDGSSYTQAISVDEGTVLNLEAVAEDGWQFDSWSGSVAEAHQAITTINMEGNKSITATFTQLPPQYSINFTVNHGSSAVAEASISINSQSLTTDAQGKASISLPDGTYSYTVSLNGYQTANGTIAVDGADVSETVNLVPLSSPHHMLGQVNTYPNPFTHSITIDNANGISKVAITNLIGQKLKEVITSGNESIIIPTNDLKAGVYLVTVQTNGGKSITRKMVRR